MPAVVDLEKCDEEVVLDVGGVFIDIGAIPMLNSQRMW